MPKTMREQLEESFEKEEEQTGGPEEDAQESMGVAEEPQGGEDIDLGDDTGETEEPEEDQGDEPVLVEPDEPGDESPPEDPPEEGEDGKPPVSWKPAIREHWGKLPKEVKAEVLRREGEIQRGLQQASGHRKIADEYIKTVQPFQALMQSMGATPSQAITTVMGTMAQLSQGSVNQKAEIVAGVIKDYGINIEALDTILSGEQLPDDPNSGLMSQFEEKLQPMYNFMEQMQGYQKNQEAEVGNQAATDLQTFAGDPKNDFFEDVRLGMADYLDVAAKNQRLMSLQEAYDRACQDSPEIKKVLAQRAAARKATPSGDELGRKRRAASSVSGSPNVGGKGNEDATLHDLIASQFEDTGNL